MKKFLEFLAGLFSFLTPKKVEAPIPDPADEIAKTPAPPEEIADPNDPFQRDLRKGSTGADVVLLQQYLKTLGFHKGSADGVFGTVTETSLKAFQKAQGLTTDGWMGGVTERKLLAAIKAATIPDPKPAPPSGKFVPPSYKVASPRRLDAELEKLMDAKALELYPAEFELWCNQKTPEACNGLVWLAGEVFAAMKVREKTNNNDGVIVEKMQWTNYGSKGDAWCMHQQQTQVSWAERKTGVVSKLPRSASCADVRARTKEKAPQLIIAELSGSVIKGIEQIKKGDIWIWLYPSKGTGHTGTFRSWIKRLLAAFMLEGNTTAGKLGDKIVREGGGSYVTERAVDTTGSMVLKMVVRAF